MQTLSQFLNRVATVVVLSVVALGAAAQEKFPSRPIEMIIPTAAGGGTDISLRMLAEIVEPILGQKVVVVNKTDGVDETLALGEFASFGIADTLPMSAAHNRGVDTLVAK